MVSVFSKPHKTFFLGGIVNSIVFMTLFLFQYLEIVTLSVDSTVYHAYSMIFIVFTQFFIAFLFTVFPRFLSEEEIPQEKYRQIFYMFNASALLFLPSLFIDYNIQYMPMAGVLLAHFFAFRTLNNMNKKSVVTNKYDTNWILVAFWWGLVAHFFFIVGFANSDVDSYNVKGLSLNIAFFLYLLMVVLTISQKMIPFFTSGKVVGYQINKSKDFLDKLFFFLILKVFLIWIGFTSYSFPIDLFIVYILIKELVKWRLPFFRVPAILWVLYLSLLWVPVGFLLYFMESLNLFLFHSEAMIFEKSALHAIAIGYVTTILIGFGTRIILGHSGRTPEADSFTKNLFWLIQLLVIIRITAGLYLNLGGGTYFDLLVLSAIVWITVFTLWMLRYIKIILE